MRTIKAKGATPTTGKPIDTGTAACKCFRNMFGVFAEFETNLRKERQFEGLAKAAAEGVYRGRPGSNRRGEDCGEGARDGRGRYRDDAGHSPRERPSADRLYRTPARMGRPWEKLRLAGSARPSGDDLDSLARIAPSRLK